jgi:hypothetical protein
MMELTASKIQESWYVIQMVRTTVLFGKKLRKQYGNQRSWSPFLVKYMIHVRFNIEITYLNALLKYVRFLLQY